MQPGRTVAAESREARQRGRVRVGRVRWAWEAAECRASYATTVAILTWRKRPRRLGHAGLSEDLPRRVIERDGTRASR